jgi:hypothetical protein
LDPFSIGETNKGELKGSLALGSQHCLGAFFLASPRYYL